MAQQGPSDAVSTARNVLAGAKKFSTAVDPNGAMAAKPQQPIATPAKRIAAPASGLAREAATAGAGIKYNEANAQQAHDAMSGSGLPKMHEGGTIPEDGAYDMQKGEHVTPAAGRQSEYRKVYNQRQQAKAPAGA